MARSTPSIRDRKFMLRALALADQPTRCLLPNPRVGAVIVRGDEIVSEAWHEGPGERHAEAVAILEAERNGIRKFSDCEIFITLEPCCHSDKRTPPCAPLLIEKKFRRVVVAMKDPNPKVSGRGVAALKRAKITVELGVLQTEAEDLNQAFIKNQTLQLPYVVLKMAMSFDGKTALDSGVSKWITGDEARADSHRLRARSDAIAIGRKTIEADDPSLNVRLKNEIFSPAHIVILGTPRSTNKKRPRFLAANPSSRIHLLTSNLDRSKTSSLPYITTPTLTGSNLRSSLKQLHRRGICQLFFEGGAETASNLLRSNLVDELVIYYGLGFIGSSRHSIGEGWALKSLQKSTKFRPEDVQLLGSDVRIRGRIHVYRTDSKIR